MRSISPANIGGKYHLLREKLPYVFLSSYIIAIYEMRRWPVWKWVKQVLLRVFLGRWYGFKYCKILCYAEYTTLHKSLNCPSKICFVAIF